jgi:hypothetical protein
MKAVTVLCVLALLLGGSHLCMSVHEEFSSSAKCAPHALCLSFSLTPISTDSSLCVNLGQHAGGADLRADEEAQR